MFNYRDVTINRNMQIIILFCGKEEKRHYMKIQSKILLERFKKNILYIAIYLISLIFGVILFYLRNKQIEFNIDEFLVLINFPKFSNLSYLYELIKIYDSVRECRKDFGNVSRVLSGKATNCTGYNFKYIVKDIV